MRGGKKNQTSLLKTNIVSMWWDAGSWQRGWPTGMCCPEWTWNASCCWPEWWPGSEGLILHGHPQLAGYLSLIRQWWSLPQLGANPNKLRAMMFVRSSAADLAPFNTRQESELLKMHQSLVASTHCKCFNHYSLLLIPNNDLKLWH